MSPLPEEQQLFGGDLQLQRWEILATRRHGPGQSIYFQDKTKPTGHEPR